MRTETERLELDVKGMTCASCATRIERKLNKLEGVDASVNYATEQATVSYDPALAGVDDLIRAVGEPNCRAMFDAWAPALHGANLTHAAEMMAPLARSPR